MREEVEIGEPHPRQRADRREVSCRLELTLSLGGVPLAEVELAQRQMGLGGLGLSRHGLLEGTLGPRRVLLPEVEDTERQV